MRVSLFLAAALGLAACAPSVPDSAAGVGFSDYNSYVRNAQAAPQTAPLDPMGAQTAAPAPTGGFSPAIAAAAIDRATGVAPAPGTTAPVTGGVIGATAPVPMATTLAPEQMAAATLDAATLDANGQRPRGNAPLGIQE